jgi:ribonuclease BN (tRNA processing enzyme)
MGKLWFAGSGGAFAPVGVAVPEVISAYNLLKDASKEPPFADEMREVAEALGKRLNGAGKFHSNMILESAGGKLLAIDAGGDHRHSWAQLPLGLNVMTWGDKIEGIVFTHVHSDHIGDSFLLGNYFVSVLRGKPRPKVYLLPGQESEIWNAISAGMKTLEGEREATLSTYAEPVYVSRDGFQWYEFTIQPIQTLHVHSGAMQMLSFGFAITNHENGKKTVLTGDTQWCPVPWEKWYRWANNAIVHDCETMRPHKSRVHAHEDDLANLPPEIKKLIVPIHFGDLPRPESGFGRPAAAGEFIEV